MDQLRRILKRFAVWVTGLRSRFAGDIFFRTTVYIVILQAGLVAVAVAAFLLVLRHTNQEIVTTIVQNLSAIITGNASSTQSLSTSIAHIQDTTTQRVFAGILVVAVLFGTMLAYVTLRPARTALEYQKLFISNIAHELRTPLSIIKTSTEVALLDPTVPRAIRETLQDTVQELDRISSIINNLLSFSSFLRPERMEFRDVDLVPIVERVIERLAYLASERGVVVLLHASGVQCVSGNETALEEVAFNLIKNAIIYTKKRKEATIDVTITPDHRGCIELTVADQGIGISKKDLTHIFEPFFRSDSSRSRTMESGGSGLGLAIVLEIIRVHRGVIRIRSTPDLGTTVVIALPAGDHYTPEGSHMNREAGSHEQANEVSMDFSRRSR